MAVTYIWKKYNSKATSTPTGEYRDSYVDDVTLTGSSYTKTLRLGESYSFDKSTGEYTLSSVDRGPVSWLEQGSGPYLMSVSSAVTTADYVYEYISGSLETTGTSSSSSFTVRAEKRQAVAETTTTYSQGTYISDVTSTSSSAYPKNGRHSDGYWYVLEGSQDSSAISGKSLGEVPVGTVVNFKVNNVTTNFIVVHQGNPNSSIYDSSCNGTWLLMQNIYEKRKWGEFQTDYGFSSDYDYAKSTIHPYLNSTFLNLIQSDIRNVIKQVKVPYRVKTGTNQYGSNTGSKGISTKIFLLSLNELGTNYFDANTGTALSYFASGESAKRIATYNSTTTDYYTRDQNTSNWGFIYWINSNGDYSHLQYATYERGIRPALILPTNLIVGSSGNIITNVAPNTPGIPTLPSEIRGGKPIMVSWTAATDSNGNLSGYQLQVQLDGGSWTQVYQGASNSYNYTIPQGTSNIAFRVRAYDSASAYSSYATSTTYAVTNLSDYGYVTIDGANKFLTGEGYATIGGVLRPLVKYLICHNSVWKSMLTGTEVVTTLPDGYVQLEYIKSSGTQYVDTGYKANGNTRVVLDFELTDASANLGVFGGRTGNNSKTYTLFWVANTGYRSDYNTGQKSVSGVSGAGRHTVDKNKGVTTIDGVTASATSATFDSGYNMYLGTINTAGTAFASGLKGNIYSCQIYDNGTLVRDFIPCMSPDGIVGLYDTSGGTFYPNNGTGEFVAGEPVAMSSYPVPKNFIQTEYIQFTGSQWIDTGLKLPSSYKIELGLTPMASRGIICGVQWSSPKFELCVWENNMGLTTADTAFTSTAITPGSGYYDLICENNAFTINGSTETRTVTASNSTAYNLLIGAHGSGEIADYHGQMKLYYFKLYSNGKLVRDFVPCINASGVAGFWDRVNGKFYGNSGSGTFTSGQTLIEGYADITPIMTSNTTPSGYVASASSVNGSAAAYMAFDSMNTTSTSERIWHSAGGMPQWIMMQFPEAVQVDMFTITNRPDTGNAAAKGITTFSLEGSNNGSTFDTLGTYTSDGAIGVTKQYTPSSTGMYKYYRINIASAGYVYSSTQYALIEQIRFYQKNT